MQRRIRRIKPVRSRMSRDVPTCCSAHGGGADAFGTFTCNNTGNISDNCTECGTVPIVAYLQCESGVGGAYSNEGTYVCDVVNFANDGEGNSWNDICCQCNNQQDCYDLFGPPDGSEEIDVIQVGAPTSVIWKCSSTGGGIGYGLCGECYMDFSGYQPPDDGRDDTTRRSGSSSAKRTGGRIIRRNSHPDSCIDKMGNSIPCNTGGNVRRMSGMRNMYGKGNANTPLDTGPPCDTDDDCPFPFVCNGTFCYYHRFGSGGGRRGGGGPRFG